MNAYFGKMQMKEEAFSTRLLLVTSDIIHQSPREDAQSLAQSKGCKAADDLAKHILSARLKLLYSSLSAEKARANAALQLLACISQRGERFITELCRRFDFELPALYKLARAPRYLAFLDFRLSSAFPTPV